MKVISMLFLSFLLTACSRAEEKQQDQYFNKVIDNYFGKYDPREKVWINNPVNKYATAEVEKSKMSFGDFENI
jgi:hypothetical protein